MFSRAGQEQEDDHKDRAASSRETKIEPPSYLYMVDLPVSGATTVAVPELSTCFRLKIVDWPLGESDTKTDTDALDAGTLRSPLLLAELAAGRRLSTARPPTEPEAQADVPGRASPTPATRSLARARKRGASDLGSRDGARGRILRSREYEGGFADRGRKPLMRLELAAGEANCWHAYSRVLLASNVRRDVRRTVFKRGFRASRG